MKVRVFSILVAVLWSVLAVCAGDVDNGYIFTCSRTLKTGLVNELQLRRYGKREAGTLKVTIYYTEQYQYSETKWKDFEYSIMEGEELSTFEMYLPKMDKSFYSGSIAIYGTFEGNYTMEGRDKVYFTSRKDDITIIQTDKPIYKPGQTVQFRILKVNTELKPKENAEADVLVENPNRLRLFQWKGVPLGTGLKQLEFLLSAEPEQGDWKIKVISNGEEDFTYFKVKEYVLPKFEVVITVPPFVLANAERIPIEICAKYTYGKNVRGVLNMNISTESYGYGDEKKPQLEITHDIDGCYEYSINTSLIENDGQYSYRRIFIKANVTEEGTDVERTERKYIQRQTVPLFLSFNQDTQQYFKPGLPYSGKLKVTLPDSTPAKGEPIEICATESRERVLNRWWATRKVKVCRSFVSDDEGVVEFIIAPQKTDSVQVSLEAESLRYGKDTDNTIRRRSLFRVPQTSMYLTPFYSPSGSFLHIQQVNNALTCGTTKRITVLFTAKDNADFQFYYQVISKEKIIESGSVDTTFSTDDDVSSQYMDEDKIIKGKEIELVPPQSSSSVSSSSDEECASEIEARYVPHVGKATIDIDVSSTLSPSFTLLVYYVRDDRETIADSQKIKVAPCFDNEVKLTFGDDLKQPGTNTAVTVTAAPNSLCGIKVVDKSISLLDSSDQLTAEKVFSLLDSSYQRPYYHSSDPCNDVKPQPGLYTSSGGQFAPPPRPYGTSSQEDSFAAFANSGFLVISDLTVITRPCKYHGAAPGYPPAQAPGYAGGAPGYPEAMNAEFSSNYGGSRPLAISAPRLTPRPDSLATKSAVDVRTYFPETWLFKMEMTGPDGQYIAKEKLPHTITEWIGSAVCINTEDGLGISNTTSITGFQAFFISFTLPYSVIRGESFWITASIFNYVQDSLPITISMENTEGLSVMSDSVDGDICVAPGTSQNIRIQLKAVQLGKVNITIQARTAESSDVCGSASISNAVAKDAITNSLIVEAEGWPVESVESMLFCPKDEKDDIFIKKFTLTLPDDVVPDSSRALLDFTGNVMGPSMDNLENLVTLPTGCGEQNMVKFVPNFVVLEYLSGVGELNDKIKERAISNLNTGAQRQMKYRHSDGSFSAFGASDKSGSMFLTAFVLRYFSQATKYIAIDDNIITKMQLWIVSKQLEDGCFPQYGRLFDSGLQGGIDEEKSRGTLTAYVLSALLISGYERLSVIDAALNCTKQNSNDMSPFTAFLHAYVRALAGENDAAKEIIEVARRRANETGGVEYYRNRDSRYGSQSKDLETAAYAVLGILESGGSASDVLPIVRYMTMNLSPRGGFVSTQDTCVGLEALSRFAKLIFKNPLDLNIIIRSASKQNLQITEDNKMLVKRYRIADLSSQVDIEAKGSGCGLLQKTLRYNSNTPPHENMFFLKASGSCLDSLCKHGKITVSARFIPDGKKSGMAVIEIKMISGIVPVKESLQKLTQDTQLDLMRFDVENNVVVFYFYEIYNDSKRFSFEVENVITVENAQNGTGKVYDYYAKEHSASTTYTLEKCNDSVSCSLTE